MPTYSYVCENCGHKFDLFQKMSDPHCKECPECGSEPKRMIGGGSGIIFKGAGWTPKYGGK